MAELKCIYGQDKNEGLVLIFVHGLGGDLDKTWMSDPKDKTTFWPRWVAEDCDCMTWMLGYDASLSAWKDSAMPLSVQGDSVLGCLDSESKLKNRPLLFIGHSLGGLLIKTVMISGLTKGVERYRELIEQVCGVVFIATPHNGAELANLAQAVKFLLRPNEQVGDLTLHNAHLITLHQQFLAQHNKSPFLVRTFAEENPVSVDKNFWGKIIKKMVVERGNAATHIPNEISIPLSEDHFSICKPKSREAQIHKSLIAFIREVINNGLNLDKENKLRPNFSKNENYSRSHIVKGETAVQSNIELMQEKLAHLEKALILETDAEVKFKLKNEISELQKEIARKKY